MEAHACSKGGDGLRGDSGGLLFYARVGMFNTGIEQRVR